MEVVILGAFYFLFLDKHHFLARDIDYISFIEDLKGKMKMKKHIGFVGGDQRILNVAESLSKKGFDVWVCAIDQEQENQTSKFNIAKNLEEIVESSDVIVGPIPFSQDGKYIFSPLSKSLIEIDELVDKLCKKGIPLIASVIPENTKRFCELKNVKYYDLYEKEELAILNAIPTAEGAIAIAIEKMPITLHSSNVLILGYGRIGKILSKILKGFECNLFVAARKISDLTWCKALGYAPVKLSELKKYVANMDLIVNTIPAKVIDKEVIDNIREGTLVIDLASKPGGVDFEYAKQKRIEVVHALSLPGKVAPKTAAQYVIEVLLNLLDELEGEKIES